MQSGKLCKVEKVRSTFHTFHDYLNFCEEKKMTGYLPFTGTAVPPHRNV